MFVEQIALVVFMLMILVGMVGGKPDAVLKPVLDIAGNLIMAVFNLVCQLTATLFGAVLSLLVTGIHNSLGSTKSDPSRQINK
jgi:hypothetical protein